MEIQVWYDGISNRISGDKRFIIREAMGEYVAKRSKKKTATVKSAVKIDIGLAFVNSFKIFTGNFLNIALIMLLPCIVQSEITLYYFLAAAKSIPDYFMYASLTFFDGFLYVAAFSIVAILLDQNGANGRKGTVGFAGLIKTAIARLPRLLGITVIILLVAGLISMPLIMAVFMLKDHPLPILLILAVTLALLIYLSLKYGQTTFITVIEPETSDPFLKSDLMTTGNKKRIFSLLAVLIIITAIPQLAIDALNVLYLLKPEFYLLNIFAQFFVISLNLVLICFRYSFVYAVYGELKEKFSYNTGIMEMGEA